jgi:hypothetical protein
MSANLRHKKDLVAAAVPKRSAQDGLGFAVVILPGVVEESNAGVDLITALVLSRVASQKLVTFLARPDKEDLTIMHELMKAGKLNRS